MCTSNVCILRNRTPTLTIQPRDDALMLDHVCNGSVVKIPGVDYVGVYCAVCASMLGKFYSSESRLYHGDVVMRGRYVLRVQNVMAPDVQRALYRRLREAARIVQGDQG